jgi:hypothetical protein
MLMPTKAGPRSIARRAGILYAISAVPAGFSVYVLTKVIVRGDPSATAAGILHSESLFRMGFVADQIGILFFLASVLMLSEVFRPVSRRWSIVMACFGVVGGGIQALDCLGDITALLMLKGGTVITTAFSPAQSQALAYQFLRLHSLIYDLALIYYGAFALLIGSLVLRSRFLPRVIGVLMTIDGLGYLTFSLTMFLAPTFVTHLYPVLPFTTAILGEGSLMLWLIVKAVDASRWEEQAAETVG